MASVKVPPVVIPVTAVAQGTADVRGTQQAVAAARDLATAQQAAQAGEAAQQRTAAASTTARQAQTGALRQYTAAAELAAAAQTKLLAVEEAGVFAVTEIAAGYRTLTAATVAVTAAQASYEAALATNVPVLARTAFNTLTLAKARQEEALSTLAAERAEAAHARQLGQVGKGAAATGLSFLGLRGATLAASGAFLAGAASIAALAKGIGNAARLETQLNVFQVTAGATADEMTRVSEAARQLGIDVSLPGVTATDAATAMTELAKAGLSVEDSISGARGVLQLATAAQIDNAAASELTANALNSFALEGEDAVHVADLFANAANAAQGSITDFGQAMTQVASVSNLVGVSIEDTTALLTELAQNGLRGSDAGTSLRTAFLRLIAPSREADALIERLGINIRDAQGNVRPDVFVQFGEATQGMSRALRDAAIATIFGQDAIRAVGIAADEGRAGLERAQRAMEETGTAAKLADARMQGLEGSAKRLGNTLEDVATQGGSFVSGFVQGLLDGINDSILGIEKLLGKIRELDGDEPVFPGQDVDPTVSERIFGEIGDQLGGIADAARFVNSALDKLPGQGLVEMGQDAREAEERSQKLAEALDRVEGNRAEIGELNLGRQADESAEAVTARIATLRNSLSAGLGELEADPTGPLAEQAERDVTFAINQLKRFGSEGLAALAPFRQRAADFFGGALSSAIEDFTGVADLVATEVPDALRQQINQLSRLGPEGQAELKRIGGLLTDSLAEGIEDNDSAERAARQKLADVIKQGRQQVTEAIRSARGNLESLGSALADQVARIVEEGPSAGIRRIAREFGDLGIEIDTSGAIDSVEELNEALDEFREQQQRRSLRFDLRQAERDLRDAREQIQTIGTLSPDERQAQQEFLDPFLEGVSDAEASLQEFDLSDAIEQQETLKRRAADAAREGILKLVQQFQAGRISAGRFSTILRQRLGPAIKDLPKENLGLEFNRDFLRNLNVIVEQAEALSGFLGRPGTEPGARASKPAETAAEAAARTAAARTDLQKQLRDIDKTAKNSDETVRVLKLINSALRPGQRNPNGKKPLRESAPVGGPGSSNDRITGPGAQVRK